MNQLATPGLGSVFARRWWAGSGQLVLALLGFAFIIGWFVQFFYVMYQQMAGIDAPSKPFPWMGKAGLVSFGAAWVWSMFTSISLLKQTRTPPVGTFMRQ
ncbi:MAG: hypothetical protein AB1813_28145 [Verrucomicrobiota bacterium]